jgi:hypothetical protein
MFMVNVLIYFFILYVTNKNKMAKKSLDRFNFREDLTSTDYQKILIEQNQTIIQLLSLQHQDLFHAGVNNIVVDMYHNSLKPYADLRKNKPNPDELTKSKKAQYLNLKRRKDEGENVDDTIKSLGLEDYFEG